MNIGIDIRAAKWYRGTGIGTYTYQLINSINTLDKMNCYNLYGDTTSLDISFNSNFHINPLDNSAFNNFWENIKTPVNLNNSYVDIYHVPQNGIGLPLNTTIPLVITLHDTIPLHMPETVGDNYLNLFNTYMKTIVSKCAGIITVSEYSKSDISKDFNFPEDKIFVTHLASENIYKPIDKSVCNKVLKKHYFLPEKYILYVGGFSPRKNITGLILAYNKILRKLPDDIKLVIAGSKGKSFDIYKNLAEDLNITDKVLFPGFISMEHMPYLYSGAELLVYPSFYEGFGLPPIEAMACGTSVIASNLTSIPEILGDSALLCDPNNIDDIAMCILNILEDSTLKQNLIKKGFIRSSSFSWKDTAEKTIEAYRSILK